MKLVSIIIVNWNGKNLLKECLTSLSKQEYHPIEIIVVDNGSTDGTVNYLKKYFSKVKIISLNKNFGFAGGNNEGYKYTKGEYVLFLNNDTKVEKNFLVELINIMESNKKIGGVQSKIMLMDEPGLIDSAGAYITPTGFLYHVGIQKKDSPKYNNVTPIFSAKGACMLFSKKVLENVLVNDELFDSRYFAYFEETDLCHRVWIAGYVIYYVPSSIVYHKMGATSSKLAYLFIQYHSFKNRINSFIKNFGALNLVKILPLHIAISESYAVFSLLKGNISMSIAVQKAIWWNIIHLRETLILRKTIQEKIRKVPDDAFADKIFKYPQFAYYLHIADLSKYEDN